MSTKLHYVGSTIGQKQVVALTGAALSLFVLSHMAGNLLMFVSPQAYNEYGHALTSNPLIVFAELGLLAAFVVHLLVAIRLQLVNRRARSQGYAVSATGDKATGWISKTMAIQGLLILVFVVLHLITFKYGPNYTVNYGKGEIRDLFRLVVEEFREPEEAIWYFAALLVLGAHLSHGIKSVLQTWGAHHPRYQRLVQLAAIFYATAVAGGFVAQPIFVFFFYHG